MKILFRKFLLMAGLFFLACASSQDFPSEKADPQLQELRLAHKNLERLARISRLDSLREMLSWDSQSWISRIVEKAESADAEELETLPFHELLAILGARHQFRHGRLERLDEAALLRLSFGGNSPLRRAFSMKLGAEWVEGQRGFRGLAKAPGVPILFWIREDDRWRLDLVSMLPVVLRGLETVGFKKKWTPVRTVLFLLEKGTGLSADRSLLDAP